MRPAPVGVKVLAVVAALMSIGGGVAWATLNGLHGRFVSACEPSHTNKDDPIVFPGEPGLSHRHQYFGARGTDAFSKPSGLRRGATSCKQPADTAAYWVPTLSIRGDDVKPDLASVYYVAGEKRRDLVRAFPPGLRMIAGRADATKRQPEERVTWTCLAPPRGWTDEESFAGRTITSVALRRIAAPHPHCGQPDARLSLVVNFPDCWDGRRLDSGNHRRHVRYSKRAAGQRYATCPASHPAPLPQINLTVVYPTTGHPNPEKIELSPGGIHSGHADFLNSWDQSELERLVHECINLASRARC